MIPVPVTPIAPNDAKTLTLGLTADPSALNVRRAAATGAVPWGTPAGHQVDGSLG